MMFNINHEVRVRLTNVGRKAHRENHDNLYKFMGEKANEFAYLPPKEDADGWSKWQLWELMREFGRCCGNGFPVPFETEIEIIDQR